MYISLLSPSQSDCCSSAESSATENNKGLLGSVWNLRSTMEINREYKH